MAKAVGGLPCEAEENKSPG